VRSLAAGERFADGLRCRGHRHGERGSRVIDRTELAERDAPEVAEERALVRGEEPEAVLGLT